MAPRSPGPSKLTAQAGHQCILLTVPCHMQCGMAQNTPHSAAAALLDFLVDLPLLTPHDKKGVLKLIKGLDPSGFDLIARSGQGISVFRTASCSSSHTGIYRVTGMGEVAAAPRVSSASSVRWGWTLCAYGSAFHGSLWGPLAFALDVWAWNPATAQCNAHLRQQRPALAMASSQTSS